MDRAPLKSMCMCARTVNRLVDHVSIGVITRVRKVVLAGPGGLSLRQDARNLIHRLCVVRGVCVWGGGGLMRMDGIRLGT